MNDLFTGQTTGLNRKQIAHRLGEIIAQLGNAHTVRDILRARRLLEDLRDQLKP